MDLFFLLFRFGPAMKMIFKIGYIPQRDDFKELTPEQYRAMYLKVPPEDLKELEGKKVVALLPEDPKVYSRMVNEYGNDLLVVSDDEIATFEGAAEIIENYCKDSGRTFSSLSEKLVYMAQRLPDVFSEGTPYAIHSALKHKPREK